MTSKKVKHISAIAAFFGIVLCASCCFAQELPDAASPWQQYIQLIRRNTLDLSTSEPFLLRFDYELYDLDGKPAGKGTAEESWGSKGSRIQIKSPTLAMEEPSARDTGFSTHTRENYLVHQVLKSYIRPLDTSGREAGFAFDRFQQTIDSAALNCFAIGLPSARTSTTTVYCADVDNHISAVTGQLLVVRRSEFLRYRDREVPSDIEVTYEGRVAITAHITSLNTIPPENYEASASAAAPGDQVVRGDYIAGAAIAGAALNRPQPTYPKQAKKKHITGSVLLCAIITKEGTITGLDVVASPNSLLSASALEAVRMWTYKPYLMNGKPTEIDTTITVNYALGH
jgi:TonB family protein